MLGNRKLISSQYPESDAQPSPDGARIVWMSVRTGSEELWASSATGESLLQLTRLNRYSGTPRWAPDGKWVAFDSYTQSGAQIFVVDSEGRNQRSVTTGTYDNAVPSWSQDGKSIYFASKRTGSKDDGDLALKRIVGCAFKEERRIGAQEWEPEKTGLSETCICPDERTYR